MDQHYHFEALAAAVATLESLLADRGIEIIDPAKSPFKRAAAILRHMGDVSTGQAHFDSAIDQRERWREAFSLGDLAIKLVAAHRAKPAEFAKLHAHLRFLAGDTELNLCSFTPGGHAGSRSEQENDFIAELRLAACCIMMMDDLEFDPPVGGKKPNGKSPDIIGRFHSQRWAIECKTLHPHRAGDAQNPEAFLSRVCAARDQIKGAIARGRAETGIVVMNLKNTVHPDAHLSTEEIGGEYYYGSHLNLPLATANLVRGYHRLTKPITDTLSERQTDVGTLLNDPVAGGHPAIAATVLSISFVIDGVLKDDRPVLTMLRQLQADPEPNAETLAFAQKLNACLQDQPNHPAESPLGSRKDFLRWSAQFGDFILEERHAVDLKLSSPTILAKVQELERSGLGSLQREEIDAERNSVVRRIWKRQM